AFNIKKYKKNETGTTIIMPYIPEKDTKVIDESVKVYPWERTYQDEIKIAIQRWYFPRILNDAYSKGNKNSLLLAKVNGEIIDPSDNLEPVFKTYQNIYNAALTGVSEDEDIYIADVTFQATEKRGDNVGRVAFKEVSREEMGMLPP